MNLQEKRCRTCLISNDAQLSKMTKIIARFLSNITALEVSLDDNLSQYICGKCQREIKSFYKFKEKCLSSAKVLNDCSNVVKIEFEENEEKLTIKTEPLILEHEDSNNSFCYDEEIDEKPVIDLPESIVKNEDDSKGDLVKTIFLCPFCNAPFSSLKLFKNHLPTIHPDVEYNLEETRPPIGYVLKNDDGNSKYEYKCACGCFSAPVYSDLLEHFKIHYGDKPVACPSCDYRCSGFPYLQRHMAVHSTDKPFKCTECDYSCKSSSALGIHFTLHTGEMKYSCKQCPLSFKRTAALSIHKMRVHDNRKNHACHLCEKRFFKLSHLRNHIAVHTGEKPHICDHCGKSFAQVANMKKHISIKHDIGLQNTSKKRYVCEICEFTTLHAGSFHRHKKHHQSDENMECDQCKKVFKNQSSLKCHQMIHSGEMKYSCSMCDYKCNTLYVLKVHGRVHSGERPFPCNICNYSGKSQNALTRHQQTHDAELKFHCANCSFKTNVRETLRRHLNKRCVIKKKGRTPSKVTAMSENRDNVEDSIIKNEFGNLVQT